MKKRLICTAGQGRSWDRQNREGYSRVDAERKKSKGVHSSRKRGEKEGEREGERKAEGGKSS